MRLRTLRALFLVEHLDLPAATGVDDAAWEAFQLAHLCDDSVFRVETKSRQIAWSWLCAAEALADAILEARSSIFVSINQDEATEKLRYARRIREALTPGLCPPLVRDNTEELELANGARLISLPARPPRGKARMNVYLDEFAHTRDDRAIYTAALPVISKGGRLRIGSSPLGASGVFWEVAEQKIRPYPGYRRAVTPWWRVSAFCVDVPTARREAPALLTAERVARFGNPRIQAIHDNMLEEDFAQEYECATIDETTAWITWEELREVQDASLVWQHVTCRGEEIDKALAVIDRVAALCGPVPAGEPPGGPPRLESTLAAGVDIGRTRNATELAFVGVATTQALPLRLSITLEGCPYDAQAAVLDAALARLPLMKLLIDRNGIGNQLAEQLGRRWPSKAQGVDFTNPSKVRWATDAKMLTQQRKVALPVDRDLSYQIHSIKKTVTASKNLVFDTARNERHHADKFWAWALSLAAARQPIVQNVEWPL